MRRSPAHTQPRGLGVHLLLGQVFPHRNQTGAWIESWEPHRGKLMRVEPKSLASGTEGSLGRAPKGSLGRVTPADCTLHSPAYWPLNLFLLGDSLSPAPHCPDLDPSVESTAALTRPWRPLPPLEGSSGFGGIHIKDFWLQLPLRSSGQKVFAWAIGNPLSQGPPHTSPGPTWNALSQVAHLKWQGSPGLWPTFLLKWQDLNTITRLWGL